VRRLYDRWLTDAVECVVMDDETYVKLDSKTLPGPQFYRKAKGETVYDSVTKIEVDKFGKNVLIWQAICTCGLKTSPFFTKGTINADVYQRECIKKRLIPFYRKHNVSTIFWLCKISCQLSAAKKLKEVNTNSFSTLPVG